MVGNVMDMMKGISSSKSSQAQKSKRTSANSTPDFGQALTDAAGAANSANAQPERQTYEQKDTSAAEKGTEAVQATQDDPKQQTILLQEGAEGQDVLTSLLQMGAEEGVQSAAGTTEVFAEQSAALMPQNVDEVQMADAVQTTSETGKIALDSLQNVSQTSEILPETEELVPDVAAAYSQTDSEMSEQMESSDAGEKAMTLESAPEEENNVIDVKAEAASDKASTSFMQLQGTNDSEVVETHVEVTEAGDIKPEYENMLKDMIARQISNGRQEFEISLTPRNLGALLVKVAVEAGETTVSIICSNAKTMAAMSSKASELGRMLEATLGDKMEVVVEDKNGQESNFYEDGRNDTGAQTQKDEQERRQEENRRRMELEAGSKDFLQQLRLGLA